MKYKTIIFLVNSPGGYINKYDPAVLATLTDYRLIVIVNNKMTGFIAETHKKYFSKIYEVSDLRDGVYYKTLNEKEVEEVIKRELDSLSSSIELLLVTHNESCIYLAAKMREKFNIPGDNTAIASLFTDKVLMKEKLKNSDIRAPEFISFSQSDLINVNSCYENVKNKIGLPFIIKPIHAAGAFGVILISNWDDFLKVVKEKNNDLLQYEAEEHIKGDLYHCDTIMQQSKVKMTLYSRYNYPLLDFMHNKNVGSVNYIDDVSIVHKLNHFNKNVLTRLKASDGIYHTEIFIEKNSGELVFLESASRTPGAYIIQGYHKSYGINLLALDLMLKLGSPFNVILDSPKNYCFWAYIPPVAGIVSNMINPNLKCHHTLTWRIKQGDKLVEPRSLNDRAGEIFLWSDDYKKLLADIDYINNNQFIEIE